MATSMLSPLSSQKLNHESACSNFVLPKSLFMSGSKLFSSSMPCSTVPRQFGSGSKIFASAKDMSFDHIPKQFRGDNLKDEVMQNFKNVPQYFYGLNPAQMDMFMTEDSPVRRQAEKVTEESISSRRNYLDNGGIWSMSGMDAADPRRYSMSVQMYRGGGGGGGGSPRPRTAPPDLPSLLLDARICYLGMPIVPAVTELLVAQFMWLDYDNPSKPIYLYINSPGTQNEKMETVGSETEAYAIADTISYCKSDVYTINCGMAFGQAAMLLSLGKKGYRAVQPHSSSMAKELDANTEYYIELLAKGTGKTKEQINEDIKRPKYLQAQAAIDYGIADKIADSQDSSFEKRDYDGSLAQRAMGRPGGGSPASPAGLR
ncbi:hypothetical protein Bca4012_064816 [Brassica carinata]